MKKFLLFVVFAATPFALCPRLAQAQFTKGGNWPLPPAPAQGTPMGHPDTPEESTAKRIDMVGVQRDADALARTAQSIPLDVESIRKGMLPKDVMQKLKQIEKLSKRLRSELNP